MGENINNALIRVISERVNMSVGETKQMIVELAELIEEEKLEKLLTGK
jgi:hypothetical protein